MKKTLIWAGLVLILVSLACNLPFGIGGGEETKIMPDVNDETFSAGKADEALLEPTELSGAQRQIIISSGGPDRFLLQFSNDMRQETWYYDQMGYSVTFRNGDVYTENRTTPDVENPVMRSAYQPWQFNQGMGLSELLAVTQSDSFAVESLAEVFVDDLSIIYLKGLDVGFKSDQVLYIRTIPLESEVAVSGSESGLNLTSAEVRLQGAHNYQVACKYSDGSVEDYATPLTILFDAEGIYLDEEEPLPRISENRYGYDDEYGFYIVDLMGEGFYTLFGFLQEIEGEAVTVTGTCLFLLTD